MSHNCCNAKCMSRGSVLHTCPPSCAHCIIKQQQQQQKQKQVLCLSPTDGNDVCAVPPCGVDVCAVPPCGVDVCAACAVPPCGPDCTCDDCDTHSTSCGPCCECLDCRDQCPAYDDDDSATTTPTYDDASCPSCTAVIDGIHGSGPYCGRVCYLSHH